MEEEYDLIDFDGENSNVQCTFENQKKHINKLRSFEGIDPEVLAWVENEILSVERRIHKYSDESLIAYIILGYQSLRKEFNIDNILEVTKTIKLKKKIFDLISGDSTKNSPIHDINFGIPIIIGSPVNYIEIVLTKFFEKRKIRLIDNFPSLCRRIEYFTYIMYESARTFSNYEPRSLACSFVFFYLSNFTNICSSSGKKTTFKKTHFKTLTFSEEGKIDINPKDFDICFEQISVFFERFKEECTSEELEQLICYEKNF